MSKVVYTEERIANVKEGIVCIKCSARGRQPGDIFPTRLDGVTFIDLVCLNDSGNKTNYDEFRECVDSVDFLCIFERNKDVHILKESGLANVSVIESMLGNMACARNVYIHSC